jgi:hypothetical protein
VAGTSAKTGEKRSGHAAWRAAPASAARCLAAALASVAACVVSPSYAWAHKTNQPVYTDPFDLGAGGAVLTRASKDGRLFANPALLPYGGKFHRWLGLTTTLLANRESLSLAREMMQNAQKGSGDDSGGGDASATETTEGESEGGGGDQNSEFIDKVLKNPVRVGWGISLAWVTSEFGLSVFSRFEPDIRGREVGATGLPEVRFQAESYHGAALGTAIRTPWRWLSLGVTGKYLYVSEPDVTVQVSDQESINQFQNPDFIQDLSSHNTGLGVDAGALAFFQGSSMDLSIAAKVDDAGGTKLTGPTMPGEFKQVTSAGLGLTLHTGADAVHFAVDYRDLGDAYGEETFKKVYAGTKVLLRTYVGLSAGYYQGYPSMGAEIDLILLRLAVTSYTRELGDHPGADPRHIYMGSLSMGF